MKKKLLSSGVILNLVQNLTQTRNWFVKYYRAHKLRQLGILGFSLFLVAGFTAPVLAVPLTSPNYKLDPQGMNSFGGQGSSANYQLVSAGGEAVVGNGSGGSYKLSSGYVGQLQQSIELSLTESGLQAYYPLDTNTGVQAYDSTANNNQGVLTNQTMWTAGKLGQALSFDGTSEKVSVPNDGSINFGTQSFSVSMWLKTTYAGGGFRRVITTEGAGRQGLSIYTANDTSVSRLRFFISDGDNQRATTLETEFGDGVWHHLVWIINRDTQEMSAYVDGTQRQWTGGSDTVTTANVGSVTSTANLFLGAQSNGGNAWPGNLDEVKLFNRALTASEIRSMYDANAAGITNAVTIPEVVPGVPQTVGLDMTVITDAGGYNAAISQNSNLTHADSSTTIAATNAGTIASPGLWDDGTTKGLGFTLIGGLSLPAKWGTGPVNYKYAALPGSSTTFFSRTGLSGGQKEVTNMQFKLDVPQNQKSGQYTNIATVTATMKP